MFIYLRYIKKCPSSLIHEEYCTYLPSNMQLEPTYISDQNTFLIFYQSYPHTKDVGLYGTHMDVENW